MMRRLLLAALIVPSAVPVAAQRVQPVLPFAPRGVDYIESVCTGGIDGRYEQVRILSNGQVMKVTRRSGGVLRARATKVEVTKIWRELDFARFEQRLVPPEKPYVMDGIDCALTRRQNGRVHTVTLMQQSRDKPRYRDLVQALDDVNEIGRRATGAVLRPAAE